jgi:hypothetical protein
MHTIALAAAAVAALIAAGVVLFLNNKGFLRAAAIQAVPPLVAVLAILFLG